MTRAELLDEISARADQLAQACPKLSDAEGRLFNAGSAARSYPIARTPDSMQRMLRRSALDCAAWALLALEKLDVVTS